LNVTNKVFAKILYVRLLPHANEAVQHHQTGFQSGKSTTDQLLALHQILEKCNEFNITTHHLFIDFKIAYDTIIRNEVYFGMSEPWSVMGRSGANIESDHLLVVIKLEQEHTLPATHSRNN
jgi:hypothetical protein